MYGIRILGAATREVAQLDMPAGRRIANRIRWLAANVEHIKAEALTGDLAGVCKLRVGDYRVVYEIVHSERMIVVHMIGHRREIYRG